MADPRDKNLVSRLADAGEQTIQRLADAPGADRFLGAMTSMRERMDDMQKKLRGLDALEKRVTTLEGRLDKLEGKKPPARKTAAKSSSGKSAAGSQSTGAKRQTDDG